MNQSAPRPAMPNCANAAPQLAFSEGHPGSMAPARLAGAVAGEVIDPCPVVDSGRAQGLVMLLAGNAEWSRGLDHWLRTEGFQVCAVATERKFFNFCQENNPACLLLDLEQCDTNGYEVLAEMRRRNLAVPTIVLSEQGSVTNAVRVMRLGAFDFLPKPHDPSRLRAAIGWGLARSARADVLTETELIRQRVARLTRRERDVLRLVVRGYLNKQVAAGLGLALVTVKVHRGRAMRKLGIKTPAELGRLAEFLEYTRRVR